MDWQPGETAPKDGRPLLVRKDACMSLAVWSDFWRGWLCHADGFDARDPNGEHVVIDRIEWWFDPDQLRHPLD
jgi:hypothetical protein